MNNQEQKPVPLAPWEVRPVSAVVGAKSPLGRTLLLGDWRGDGFPSPNEMRLTGLVWGLLLAGVCLVIYRLQPPDREWAATLEDTAVGWGLLLLLVLVGFLVGNVVLQARQHRNLSPAVTRAVLLALLVGGVLGQWSWRASSVWVVALILTPLLAAVLAYLLASLTERGHAPAVVALAEFVGLAMVVTGVSMLLPPQAGTMIVMAVNPQGPVGAVMTAVHLGGICDLPRLMTDLRNPDFKVAREAANAIADLNDPRAIEPLRQAAQEPTPGHTAMMAVYALSKITDPRAQQVLQELTKDHRLMWLPEVRRTSVTSAQQQVGPALADVRNPMVEKRIAAMAVLELAAAREHLPVILQALRDPDARVRVSAARTLQRLEDPRALDALIVAARDGDRSVRNVAIFAIAELEDPRAIPILLEASANETESDRQRAAFRGLAELADPRSARAMIKWMALEHSASPPPGRRALVGMKTHARVPLIEAATSKDYYERKAAISLLRELYSADTEAQAAIRRGEKIFDATALEAQLRERGGGPTLKADLLLRAARSDDPALHAVAAEAIDGLSGDENQRVLMAGLDDSTPRVRALAVRALGSWRFDRDAERAVQDALMDSSPLVRRAAIQKAHHTFGQGAVDIIVQHLNRDPDVQVRLLAAKRFEEHMPSKEDQPLIYDTLLHDNDPRVRAAVAHIIERRCREYAAAYEALEKASKDPHPAVRAAARKAIARIDQYRRDYGPPQR